MDLGTEDEKQIQPGGSCMFATERSDWSDNRVQGKMAKVFKSNQMVAAMLTALESS